MKRFLASYKSSLILLGAIIIGGIAGYIIGPDVAVVRPFGDLFLNLLFMIIVPLVFFSITTAIANMSEMKRLGKIMVSIIIVFFSTALISAIIGLAGTSIMNPIGDSDVSAIKELMTNTEVPETEDVTFLSQLVNTFTVSDFSELLSRQHILQLIVFSVLIGLATAMAGEKGRPVAQLLTSATEVLMKVVKIIMYYAPIGLGCYFAAIIGELGPQILEGYARSFVLYMVLSIIYFFGFFTLYAFIAAGKDGIRAYWTNVLPPSVTAIATCSSAACIPINLDATKKIGVPVDIAETVIPLGANTHKDGSVIGGVLKIVFLFSLFGRDLTSVSSILSILAVAFLVGAVMGAIPGGGMIGEMLILTVFGFSPEVLPLIAVISTIIDIPATLLNSTGNTVCAMLVARLVEGKNWLKNAMKKTADA
ncbi:dicarboxylate/amino acid:cation symporter [Gracilibacillus sp. Marseille-QA3620]